MPNLTRGIVAPFARPVWRRIRARMETRLAPVEARLAAIEARLDSSGSGPDVEPRILALEALVARLEAGWQTHVPAFLNAVSSVGAFGHQLAQFKADLSLHATAMGKRIDAVQEQSGQNREQLGNFAKEISQILEQGRQLDDRIGDSVRQLGELWQRLEFVRRETLFEFAHGKKGSSTASVSTPSTEPRIIAADKVAAAQAADDVRLNLGCGHIALPGYLNVDRRDLPGVDVVAEIDNLPFKPGSVQELHSAHLVEHFPLEMFRRRVLPYWYDLLKPGGLFRAVTPDAAAMIAECASGTYPYDEFREVMFGAQDYDGDYHYNLFTPDSLCELLGNTGFTNIEVLANARRNGKCYEFEIVGVRA